MGFAEWYVLYPKKIGRGDAEKAYNQQLKKGFTHQELVDGIRAYSASVVTQKIEKQFIPFPASWLRGMRWMDEGLQPMPDLPLKPIPESWKTHADRLIKEIGPAQFGAWFIESQFDAGPPAKITFPKPFYTNWVDKHFSCQLRRLFGEIELEPK